MNNTEYEAVQSCISSINFPDNIPEYVVGLNKSKEENNGKMMNDVDHLIHFGKPDVNVNTWSAPDWLTTGDIMFFYMTKSYRKNVDRMQSIIRSYLKYKDLASYINRSDDLADLYSGTIFACAEIADSSFYSKGVYPHHDDRTYAPLKDVHVFENPVTRNELFIYCEVKIGQGTITSLFGKHFENLVTLLRRNNKLPLFLENKKAEEGFKGIKPDNWIDKSCNPERRFRNEEQVRVFFIDYFLEDVKDERTPLLKECECYKGNKCSGSVDYVISLKGQWIPVEAKTNIAAERDIRIQIMKYINTDYFKDGEGRHFTSSIRNICLLIDQSGLYITLDGEFLGCKIGSPYWRREDIKRNNISEIRMSIIDIIGTQKGCDV